MSFKGSFFKSNVLTRNMSPAPSASLPVIIGYLCRRIHFLERTYVCEMKGMIEFS